MSEMIRGALATTSVGKTTSGEPAALCPGTVSTLVANGFRMIVSNQSTLRFRTRASTRSMYRKTP